MGPMREKMSQTRICALMQQCSDSSVGGGGGNLCGKVGRRMALYDCSGCRRMPPDTTPCDESALQTHMALPGTSEDSPIVHCLCGAGACTPRTFMYFDFSALLGKDIPDIAFATQRLQGPPPPARLPLLAPRVRIRRLARAAASASAGFSDALFLSGFNKIRGDLVEFSRPSRRL